MKKNKNNLIAYYSIFLGILVLLMWGFILLTEPIRDGKNEMIFHLLSEILMAALCITSGLLLIKNGQQNLNIAAHAMVIYSVINAAGYYFEKNEFLMTAMFFILFIFSLFILTTYFLSRYFGTDETFRNYS
ncbi:hypothetical protein N9164_14180 [Draconibacterium sp.]|nr:hypothetical protein [Draconibacterium sp.]